MHNMTVFHDEMHVHVIKNMQAIVLLCTIALAHPPGGVRCPLPFCIIRLPKFMHHPPFATLIIEPTMIYTVYSCIIYIRLSS
jgi:hypothetical protein